jgi:topoisomerase-4 subunit A
MFDKCLTNLALPNQEFFVSKVENSPVEVYAPAAYLGYAMHVVKGRAIPDVEDGLKPVQRRVLYAMHQLRLFPSAKAMKSARVVGDVLGRYHPHGDSATYDAMVRMAQDFTLRYPLVHGEGNFGSRDDDPAAAYRYTEAKLTPIAEALLGELKWDTVDFRDNYDGKEVEPVTLPARLPFLLLNGASGIAVGLATEQPPHNLVEIAEAARRLIKNPKTTQEDVLDCVPGPDFATGCALINSPEDIRKIYSDGRGSFRLRARWKVVHDGKKWHLVFYEIPQSTNVKKIMESINELVNPTQKEKGGKKQPLTAEQTRLKKWFGDLIELFEDHSDKEQAVALAIYPKDKKMDPNALAMALCGQTDLEVGIPVNMVAVDSSGSARLGNLFLWIGQWCEYRVATVRRRTIDEKAKVDHRLHVLEGRLSILDRIQEVVKVLTVSSDPKGDLIKTFALSEIQAEDILELRLRSLARLESVKLKDEQGLLIPEQARLAGLLADDKSLRKLVIAELDRDVKTFGDARRTVLEPADATSRNRQTALSIVSETLAPEPLAVVLTERGWIAWRPAKTWDDALSGDFKIKAGDQIRRVYWGDRHSDHLMMLDGAGRAFSLRLTDLPSKADAAPLTTWFDLKAPIVEAAIGGLDSRFVLSGQNGYGFVVCGADWINRMKAGKAMLRLEDGEAPLPPMPIPAQLDPATPFLALASDGRAVAFPWSEIKALPKGKGVGLIGLAKGCTLSDITLGSSYRLQPAKGNPVSLPADLSPWLGSRSAGKKGRNLHKHAVSAIFLRPGRELPVS